MKANELQIGDFVRCGEILVRITRISETSASGIDIDALEPIPLTEEILKANGFIHHDYWNKGCYAYDAHKQDILWSMDFYFAPKKGRMEFGAAGKKATINDWHCEYVHELQHAIRLCGLNELADNFKLKEDRQRSNRIDTRWIIPYTRRKRRCC